MTSVTRYEIATWDRYAALA